MNQYLYDGEGRICAVSQQYGSGAVLTGYLYNADGVRVAKGTLSSFSCDLSSNGFTLSASYVLDQSGNQVTEMSGPAGNQVWKHTNVWAGSTLLASYDADGLHFHVNDPLGTRRVQTDQYGVVEQSCQSLPFGDALSCSGSVTTPTEHHFTGKERDAESGNDYFQARYYASTMGRFMSPDPGWFSAADPTDPQSWNLYSYARNNPLINIDPDGYDCVYLNNAGTDVDRDKKGNVTGIDHNSSKGECMGDATHKGTGGYWVDGTFDHGTVYANSNDVWLTGHTTGSNGSSTATDAFYTNAQTPMSSAILQAAGYTGITGTVDMLSMLRNHPRVDTIGPQNPLDVAIGCAASGAPKLALDLSPIGIVPDLADAAMSGSLNPLVNSGDRLNDAGNAVDVAGKAAGALKNTLPFLGPVAKKLGPVGATISVVKAGRDFYNCAR